MTNKQQPFPRGSLLGLQQNKGRGVKLCHSKIVPPSKISLSYPQCFIVSRVHPFVRVMFPTNPVSQLSLAGKIKFFYSNLAKLTQDLNILNIAQGFETLFLENPVQGKSPNPPVLNQEQSKLVKEELKEIMLKGAIQSVSPCKNQYLKNFLLVSKRGGGNRPVINLKHLNNFIPYQHFKMEGLNLLQKHTPEGRLHVQAGTKRRVLSCFSKKELVKYVRFQWEGTLYEFLCLCFGLGPALLIFTKILKVPISLLRRL